MLTWLMVGQELVPWEPYCGRWHSGAEYMMIASISRWGVLDEGRSEREKGDNVANGLLATRELE